MIIRKFDAKDREGLISLWKNQFPNDPPHNEPSKVIDSKLKVAAFYRSLGFAAEDRLSMGVFL